MVFMLLVETREFLSNLFVQKMEDSVAYCVLLASVCLFVTFT